MRHKKSTAGSCGKLTAVHNLIKRYVYILAYLLKFVKTGVLNYRKDVLI